MVKYRHWTENETEKGQCSKKKFESPPESLENYCSRPHSKITRKSGYLEAKYKEIMGGLRLLHCTV